MAGCDEYRGYARDKSVKVHIRQANPHFKNTVEVSNAIRGLPLEKAERYLRDVIARRRAIPFRRFDGGVGRTAQAKEWGVSQARWPVKSCRVMLDIFKALKTQAEAKNLQCSDLSLVHVNVNEGLRYHRRTFRAHGRISGRSRHTSNIMVIASQNKVEVPKITPKEEKKLTPRKIRKRLNKVH